ncbi:MAG: AraC family transcriptional regulator [Myxococcales bacterium]|nr:AraC family transcriptional regulator [Myxococcales bacterium]
MESPLAYAGLVSGISCLLVQPLLLALGGDEARTSSFWKACELAPEQLLAPDARIGPAQFAAAWDSAVALSERPTLALWLADQIPAGTFGVVEYVCRSANSLGDALRQWVRYLNLLDDAVEVGLLESAGVAELRVLRESPVPAPASHELCFALLMRRAQELLDGPTLRAVRVDFQHHCLGEAKVYEDFFAAPVKFGAQYTQLVLPSEALGFSLKTTDPALLEILSRHAADLQGALPTGSLLAEQVRSALQRGLRNSQSSIEDVASELGLTARSLQRRLKEEGHGFKELRDEVRSGLAKRYLDSGLSAAEISFLLGFSEPSAFFRAFKRWTGVSPLESRARS